MKLEFGKSWVRKEMMEHVRLLVVVRCENDVIHNVFKSLIDPISHRIAHSSYLFTYCFALVVDVVFN